MVGGGIRRNRSGGEKHVGVSPEGMQWFFFGMQRH
jgi:hypothetical protein